MVRNNKLNRNYIILVVIIFIILSVVTLTNSYYGSTDVSSFTSVAKYFAGEYPAKIRSSHSYLWGWMNSDSIHLHGSFIGFKILNLIVFAILISSIYKISGQRKETLLLTVLSPILWFMGSWVNSIQIASLCFLWCYAFMRRFEDEKCVNS